MSEIIIKNLPRRFRSLVIDFNDYKGKRAESFFDNIKEFINDEKLSNEIAESDELSNVLELIDNKI